MLNSKPRVLKFQILHQPSGWCNSFSGPINTIFSWQTLNIETFPVASASFNDCNHAINALAQLPFFTASLRAMLQLQRWRFL
jgi:hypothetical protein